MMPDAGAPDARERPLPRELTEPVTDDWYCYLAYVTDDPSQSISFCYQDNLFCDRDRRGRSGPGFTLEPCKLHERLKVKDGSTWSERRYCGDTMEQCKKHRDLVMRHVENPEIIHECKMVG